MKNSSSGVEGLCQALLRQISGGDNSPSNVWLAENVLGLLNSNRFAIITVYITVELESLCLGRVLSIQGTTHFTTTKEGKSSQNVWTVMYSLPLQISYPYPTLLCVEQNFCEIFILWINNISWWEKKL